MYFYILKAVIILLYFFILNAAYENVESGKFQLAIQILTMIFLFIAIYLFEKSYKQDDGEMAINGIEVLILSAYTLTTDHITNKFGFNFKIYSLVASYLYSIYFVMRANYRIYKR